MGRLCGKTQALRLPEQLHTITSLFGCGTMCFNKQSHTTLPLVYLMHVLACILSGNRRERSFKCPPLIVSIIHYVCFRLTYFRGFTAPLFYGDRCSYAKHTHSLTEISYKIVGKSELAVCADYMCLLISTRCFKPVAFCCMQYFTCVHERTSYFKPKLCRDVWIL